MNQPLLPLLDNSSKPGDAFDALVEGWLADELSPPQAAQLAAMLRQDAQAARQFAARAKEWQMLATVAHQQVLATDLPRTTQTTLAGPGHRDWPVGAMAMAATLAAAVLWFLLPNNQPGATSTELASLSTDNGEVVASTGPNHGPSTGLRLTPPLSGSVTMAFDRHQQRRVVLTVQQ